MYFLKFVSFLNLVQHQLSNLEILATIFAAAIHDVAHPGVNNDFLIDTSKFDALVKILCRLSSAVLNLKMLWNKIFVFLSEKPPEKYRPGGGGGGGVRTDEIIIIIIISFLSVTQKVLLQL